MSRDAKCYIHVWRAQLEWMALDKCIQAENVMVKVTAVILALVCATAPAWAVHKCTGADGKVSYQEQPCAGKGEELKIRPQGSPMPVAPTVEKKASPAAATPVAAIAVPSAPAGPPPKTELDRQADQCLNYYRPLLRDPAGAYHSNVSKDRGEVTIRLHAKNGYGGYVSKSATCEFKNDELDADWTKIHAQRAGW